MKMETGEIKYLISHYFDDELKTEKEILLFSELSKNEELRSYFKKYNMLKSAALHDIKPFPAQLEKRILNTGAAVPAQKEIIITHIKKFSQLLPYAAAIVLFILALLYSRKSDAYEKQIFSLTREVEDQNDKIELLFHALPPIEVTPNYKQTNHIYYNR
jgi:hypothetical protein